MNQNSNDIDQKKHKQIKGTFLQDLVDYDENNNKIVLIEKDKVYYFPEWFPGIDEFKFQIRDSSAKQYHYNVKELAEKGIVKIEEDGESE